MERALSRERELTAAADDGTDALTVEFVDERGMAISEVSSNEERIKLPGTVADARQHKLWPLFKTAMEEEIEGKLKNKAWTVVSRPAGKAVMKGKWVFAIKYNTDQTIKRVKARFVACGYSQTTDDYDQCFAATLPCISARFLLACIADEDLEDDHIDAVKAFTQADVDRELYVEMPIGFSVDGCVLLLHKALEGIKQGAHLWFKHNQKALKQCGCDSWINEPNIYTHGKHGFRIGVCLQMIS